MITGVPANSKPSLERGCLLAVLLIIATAIVVAVAEEGFRRATEAWLHGTSSVSSPSEIPEPEFDEDVWVSLLERYVSVDRQWDLLLPADVALAFIIPAGLFLLCRRWIGSGPAVLLVVGAMWIVRHAFRMTIELPICLSHAELHGDVEYDGVGVNVAVLFFGWVEPLLTCLVIIGIGAAWRAARRLLFRAEKTGRGEAVKSSSR